MEVYWTGGGGKRRERKVDVHKPGRLVAWDSHSERARDTRDNNKQKAFIIDISTHRRQRTRVRREEVAHCHQQSVQERCDVGRVRVRLVRPEDVRVREHQHLREEVQGMEEKRQVCECLC